MPDFTFRGPCRVMDCRGAEFKHNKPTTGKGGRPVQSVEHAIVGAASTLKGRRIALLCRNPTIAEHLRDRILKAYRNVNALKPEGSGKEREIQELQGLNINVVGPQLPHEQIVLCGWTCDSEEPRGYGPTTEHKNYVQTKAVVNLLNVISKGSPDGVLCARLPASDWGTRRTKTLREEEEGFQRMPFPIATATHTHPEL